MVMEVVRGEPMTEKLEKQRSESRVELLTKCQLEINGKKYNCLVDNISTTGAAVEMAEGDQECIHVGDMGTLDVLLLSSVTYLCKVVRIDSNLIGVQFID
jgi:PilZ domain